jgi:hypothetical protein
MLTEFMAQSPMELKHGSFMGINSKVAQRFITGAFILCYFLGVSNHSGHWHYGLSAAQARQRYGSLSPDMDAKTMQAHEAGLSGDTTQIPAIIDLFRQPVNPDSHETAMLALARLGATQALPQFDILSQDKDNPEVARFALTARARLVAESQTQALAPGPARSAAKVSRFYQELNLSPQDLNAALADFQHNYSGKLHVTLPQATEVGLDAVDQLADMVYHDAPGVATEYASLPGIAALNFAAQPPAALKMRLAPLSKPERIATMIQDMMHKKKWSPLENDETQLLDDEGLDASHAVAAQLKLMEQHRTNFITDDYEVMFGVLYNIGDKEQAPLIAHFKEDANPAIADLADRVYGSIVKGIKMRIVYGY